MGDFLESAAKIKQPLARRTLELAYFYVSGIDGLITAAGVLALFVVYLPIADATFRTVAQIFHTFAPLIFVAVAVRASYLSGALEEQRNARVIVHTREHITKMNEVASQVRQRVQFFGTTDYYSNTSPAGTGDLVKALDSHFGDLHLDRWDVASKQLQAAREAVENQVKSLGDQGKVAGRYGDHRGLARGPTFSGDPGWNAGATDDAFGAPPCDFASRRITSRDSLRPLRSSVLEQRLRRSL